MLYKMNKTISSARSSMNTAVSFGEEIHDKSVKFISNYGDVKNSDAKLSQYYEEAVGYMREFENCREELKELSQTLNTCINMTEGTERNVILSILHMFEQAKEKEFSTLSKYDAYLSNRERYAKNYDMWEEKNYNALSIINSAANDAWEELTNFPGAVWDMITGKDMVNEIQVGHIKEIIHSALQKKCQNSLQPGKNEFAKGFLDSVYDGKDIIDHGMDISELYLSGKLSDSQMKELSELSGIGLDDLGKFMKYGKVTNEQLEYMMADYTENLKYLESLENAFSQVENPVVVEQVMSELKSKYSKEFFANLEEFVGETVEMAGDKVMDAVFDMTPGTKALKTVADGIDIIRKTTDYDKNMDNWSSIVYYNQEFRPTLDNVIDTYLDKYNSGTASTEDINTLNTLIEVDGSIKEVMYERMSIKNEGFADEFSEGIEYLKM